MPEPAFASEWDDTSGHPLIDRVLKVKRMFRVSYKTFSWNWNRAGEPEGVSEYDFLEDRLYRLVRTALKRKIISLGRAANCCA
jgi:hypothetical protein